MHSNGQKLLHKHGVKQAVCFHASLINQETRLRWSGSFPKEKYRGIESKISASALFLVISQNCDIAARSDEQDSAIELIVCKSIKVKKIYAGNQFAHSSRKLQFLLDGTWYEANTEYLITVEKSDLLSIVESNVDFELHVLAKEYQISVPIWRSNRYYRTGLPDKFNEMLFPALSQHMTHVESAASVENVDFKSFIRAMYVKIDTMAEVDTYSFEFFALLRDSVPDRVMCDIQQAVEKMADELAEKSGFTDNSSMYADRDTSTTVSYLNDFLRLNLDHHSLSQGDDDVGPDPL